MTGTATLGSLKIDVIRSASDVALITTSSPTHREYFFIAAGQNTLTVTVVDAGEKSLPEPPVHVFHRLYDWNMAPKSDPPSTADDQALLLSVW